jgi:hypothetical protein
LNRDRETRQESPLWILFFAFSRLRVRQMGYGVDCFQGSKRESAALGGSHHQASDFAGGADCRIGNPPGPLPFIREEQLPGFWSVRIHFKGSTVKRIGAG